MKSELLSKFGRFLVSLSAQRPARAKRRFAAAVAMGAMLVFAFATSSAFALTVERTPTNCVNDSTVGTRPWNSPERARQSDNSYAFAQLFSGATSNYLRCTDFGFSILPVWATINGITVKVERLYASGQNNPKPLDSEVRLIKASAIVGSNGATSTIYTTADVVEAHGGANSLWGTTWKPAEINGSAFGVVFATRAPMNGSGTPTVGVDAISIMVDYVVPERNCVSVASGNWSAAATWNCGDSDGPPIATDNATINNDTVTLDTDATVASLTINSGALRQGGIAARTLAVTGNLTSSGAVADNGASGSLAISVGGDLTINGASFLADTLTVSANTTTNAALTVNGTFNVGGNVTNNSAAFTVGSLVFTKSGSQSATFYGTSTTITDFTVNTGSTVTSNASSTLNLKGNLTNNGTISLPSTSWIFNGSSLQRVTGSSDTTFANLTLNNVSGLLLARNVTVTGTLTLSRGLVTTGSYILTVGGNCPTSVAGGDSDSFVNGNLRLTFPAWGVTCTYPVGTATAYAPISLTIPWFNGITGGTLTGRTDNGEHPQVATSGIQSSLDVNRYWTLGASGDMMSSLPSGGSYSATFAFLAGDVDTGATIAKFKTVRYSGSVWSIPAGSATENSPSATGGTATFPGTTAFGSFAVGTIAPVVRLTKTASAASAVVGDVITFTISVSNPSADTLSNVVVSDVLPAGMSYSTHAATLGSVAQSGQNIAWTIPSMASGATAQMTLAVSLNAQGTLTNTVTSPGANSASASILVLAGARTHFRLDEPAGSWTGSAGEIIDSGGTALHGQRRTTTNPTATNAVIPSPTIDSLYPSVVGGFCNAGRFDGNAVISVARNAQFDYTSQLSASAWIYPTALPSEMASILSNDVNYEFHLNSSGKLYWWWNSSTLTSAATIPLNTWTHIAITFSSASGAGRQKIYINGVPDANTNNWTGTLAANSCPFYIGGDISTNSNCTLLPARNFRGMIDEVKLYKYELSAAEVQADMNLGRNCSGTFDHIRIEHDGVASVCAPETVIVKACFNEDCSTLYTGDVTVRLSPSGWIGGDTFTFSGGVTSRQLSYATAGDVTLGMVSVSPAPGKTAPRCFKGSTETCTINFASSSCSFDAVEPGAAPQTRLFTKLAGVPFNVDVLALTSPSTVNTGYTGTVNVDLVDASSSACPTGAGLTSTNPITYAAGNAGRKTVQFTYVNAARNVRVRAKVGSSAPACSTDSFAVRPSGFTSVTSSASADGSGVSATATPVVKTETAFTLSANSGVPGYDGKPTVNPSLIEWPGVPSGGRSAPGTGTLAGSFSNTANGASGNNANGSFTYDEVGYFRFRVNGVFDDSFVADSGDKLGGDCVVGNFSNTLNGQGKYGCNFGNTVETAHFGRFIPDHFDTAVTQGCDAGGFSYSGQPFQLQVTAKNGSGGTTQNYTAAFAKVVTLMARNEGDTENNPGPGALSPNTIQNTKFNAGVGSARPSYTFTNRQTPETNVRLRALDTDGVTSLRTLPSSTVEGTTKVRSGRVRLGNAYGSELLDLPVVFRTEFWNGSGWVLNTADSCTGNVDLDPNNAVSVGLTNSPGTLPTCVRDSLPALSGGAACATAAPMPRRFREGATTSVGFAGDFNLWLAAPGANNFGTAKITATVPSWFGPVPDAMAAFGRYKTPLIYRRENF